MNLASAQNFRLLVLVLTAFFFQSAAGEAELAVPAGCAALSHPGVARTFYIDPVHGNMQNDGSAERPWRTFAEVASQASHLISTSAFSTDLKTPKLVRPVNPDGPIKPGDTLVLMSGDHGDVDVRLYQNTDFIHVVAGKNQTPVIPSMKVVSTSHWSFEGLKFQGVRPEKNVFGGNVEVMDTIYGPSDNIIFAANSFSTKDDVTDWADADWVKIPYLYAIKTGSHCVTLFENRFYNIRNAGGIDGADVMVLNNVVDGTGNDGFDITASNLTVRGNIIKSGHHTPAEPMHADGIQGWSIRGLPNKNVVIDSNMVIDTNQSDDNYMQGITIFDGVWDGLVVSNNVILTNVWHGIALYGVDNAVVINNTVVPSRPFKYMTWITIQPSKTRPARPSSNVVVRNNIAGQIVAGGTNVEVDHNIALRAISSKQRVATPGVASGATLSFNMENVPTDMLFRRYDVGAVSFDLRLAPKSPAIEAGSPDLAPAVDVEGRPRKAPIDIGAYAR